MEMRDTRGGAFWGLGVRSARTWLNGSNRMLPFTGCDEYPAALTESGVRRPRCCNTDDNSYSKTNAGLLTEPGRMAGGTAPVIPVQRETEIRQVAPKAHSVVVD
eukprot:1181915-Prorocentrum_minimum.AAC.4